MRKLLHIFIIAMACSAHADTLKDTVKPFAHQVFKDAKDIATAPLRWRQHQWLRFAEGVAIVAGAYAADDRNVRFVSRQQNHVLDTYLRDVTNLGGGNGFDIAGLLAGGGQVRHDVQMMDSGMVGWETSIAA